MITGGKAKQIFETRLKQAISEADKVLDIGTSQRFAKELRPYESWFDGKSYLAAGYEPELTYGTYNCDLHADIENIPFEDNSFDTVICLEVIEHVQNPFKAAAELYRILKPNGILLLTTPFMLGYHGKNKNLPNGRSQSHASYPDFWRFTHEGLFFLFARFGKIEMEVLNGPLEVALMTLRLSGLLKFSLFRRFLDWVDRPRIGSQTSRHLILAKKIPTT